MLMGDVLKRGQLMIKMPAMVILLALLGQALLIGPSGVLPTEMTYVSLGLGVLCWPISVLYIAIMTPRWKLWAYGQVHNVAALKAAAVDLKIISPDGSLFEKMEICSKETRAQIRKLEGRA